MTKRKKAAAKSLPLKTAGLSAKAAPPIAAPEISKMSLREVAWSSLVFLCLIAVYFHGPILGSWIAQQTSLRIEPGQGLVGGVEDVYSGYPPFYFSSRQIRQGKLPLWTPHTCGGTPFIGKQSSRVFSPFQLLFYLTPARYFQYLWLVSFVLQFYFAWISTFLLARWYGIGFKASLLAAAGYSFSQFMIGASIEATGETSIYIPALFLLTEQFLHGDRRRGLLFLPWLIAFPVLSGHLQITFYAWVSLAVYALAILWLERRSMADGVKKILLLAGAAILGVALASGNIIIGLEYIARSYTKAWRSLPEFGWSVTRISRSLTQDDAPILTLGLLMIGLCAWSIRKMGRDQAELGLSRLWPWAAGALSLALFLACFMNVGLLSPWIHLSFTPGAISQPTTLLFGALCYFLALLALLDSRLPRGLKIMGVLLLFGRLMYLRTPLLVNVLYNAPLYKSLSMDQYHTSADLGLALLSAYGLWRLEEIIRQSWEQKKQVFYAMAQLTLLIATACVLSVKLRSPVARLLGVGINPKFAQAGGNLVGGIADAGHVRTPEAGHAIRGWVYPPEAVQNVFVGFFADPRLQPARIRRSLARLDFDLPVTLKPGKNTPVAMIVGAKGEQTSWQGSDISLIAGPSRKLWIGLIVLLAALHALLLVPWNLGPVLAASLFGFYLAHISVDYSGTKGNLTFEWPAIKLLKQDKDVFRIFAFEQFLFPTELGTIHGLSDIRHGGDNLDVLTMLHFFNFGQAMFKEQGTELGSQWLGLGNVKYVLSRPNQPLPHKGLDLVGRGEDMLVYLNRNFSPRLRFFDSWKHLDGGALDDWQGGRSILRGLHKAVTSGQFDLKRDLLLHSAPPPDFPAPSSAPQTGSKVEILDQGADRLSATVESPRDGFLFISSNYFPGWKAYVDGRPVSLMRSFITFCAIPVPRGRHSIHFIYHSARAHAALVINALAALVWVGWWCRVRAQAKPALNQHPGKDATNPSPAWSACDGSAFLEKILVGWVWSNLLFWLNWCAWVYGGGVSGKVAALYQWAVSGRSLAELGLIGYPYALGPFEGWLVNLAAAAVIGGLGFMFMASRLAKARNP